MESKLEKNNNNNLNFNNEVNKDNAQKEQRKEIEIKKEKIEEKNVESELNNEENNNKIKQIQEEKRTYEKEKDKKEKSLKIEEKKTEEKSRKKEEEILKEQFKQKEKEEAEKKTKKEEEQIDNIFKNALKNCNKELFNKCKNLETFSYFFENNFDEKIMFLINKLKDYNKNDIEYLYEFISFLKNEKTKLEDIIHNFPLITYKNRNAYFASYYFYVINKLLNLYENYEENVKNKEYFNLDDNEEENEEEDENELNKNKEIQIIKSQFEEKKNVIIKKMKNLFVSYDNIIKNNNNVDDNNILIKFDINIGLTEQLNENIKQMKKEYIKLNNILNNLEGFYSKFFQLYLNILSKFLCSIKNTINYFNEKIIINKCSDKENIEEFDYFIYYIFNYDYISNYTKLTDIVNYFEDYFKNKEYENKKWEYDSYKFEIKNNILFQVNNDWINQKIKIENCENYCIKLIEKEKLKEHKFLNQKFLWFFKFQKNNIFEKNKIEFVNFFKNIFKKDKMKKLMINIFPYLQTNYIINEYFIDEFFDKIKTYNFKPENSCGETIFPILNVYVKNYFEQNDNIESEICAITSLIIVIMHELAHYIRIYIYQITGDIKYRKSIDLCSCDEIGDYLETLLFGNTLFRINLFQAIFILNENNYNKFNFKEEFNKLEKCKHIIEMENFKENFESAKIFLKKLNIDIKKSEIKKPSNLFTFKSEKNFFVIGYNNDKGGRSKNINTIFKGTPFECLLDEKY
jgi:hypothetical protein